MKPLVTSHRYLAWLCLCTPDESSNKWHKRAYIIFTTSILIILLSHTIADMVYCLIMLSTNLQSCLFVILCIAGQFCTTYSLLIGLLLMPQKIDKILKNLQTLYSTCKYSKWKSSTNFVRQNLALTPFCKIYACSRSIECKPLFWYFYEFVGENMDSFQFLAQANDASECMWKIYYKYMAGVLINVVFTAGFSVFHSWSSYSNDGHLDPVKLYYPQDRVM